MAKKKKNVRDEPRSVLIPIDTMTYTITPELVRRLTYAHSCAGKIASMRFSYYVRRKLDLRAKHERIANMVFYSAGAAITAEEVGRVLAGDVLHPRKRKAMDHARVSGVLTDAVGVATSGCKASTPRLCETYLRFAEENSVHWASMVGNIRSALLEIPRESIDVRESVSLIYEWINKDELVSKEPILRAAALYWYLLTSEHSALEIPAILSVMDHELRAGQIDTNGWMWLKQSWLDDSAFLPKVYCFDADQKDLTPYFEHFASTIGTTLFKVYRILCSIQDDEERLPWLSIRPPDALDRQIFDIIESLGSARTSQIIDQIPNHPPLRTLQRRLLKLCKNGLLTKHGSRRDAYYQITQRY